MACGVDGFTRGPLGIIWTMCDVWIDVMYNYFLAYFASGNPGNGRFCPRPYLWNITVIKSQREREFCFIFLWGLILFSVSFVGMFLSFVPVFFILSSCFFALKINGTILLLLHNATVFHPEVTSEPVYKKGLWLTSLKLQCAFSNPYPQCYWTFKSQG